MSPRAQRERFGRRAVLAWLTVGIAAIVLPLGWRMRRRLHADANDDARAGAAKLPNEVSIEPFGLRARTPAGWTCSTDAYRTFATSCAGDGWRAQWEVVELAREAPAPEVRSRHDPRVATIAGFVGELFYEPPAMRGVGDYIFIGSRDGGPRGKLHLRIEVDGSMGGLSVEFPEWIVFSTREGPDGLANRWRTRAERAVDYRADGIYKRLTAPRPKLPDASVRDPWPGLVAELAEPRDPSKPTGERVGDSLLTYSPSGPDVVTLRMIDAARAMTPRDSSDAVNIATSLVAWRGPEARSQLAKLAATLSAARKEHASDLLATPLARESFSLAALQAAVGDTAPLAALLQEAGSAPESSIWGSYGVGLRAVVEHRAVPEYRPYLDVLLDVAHLPPGIDEAQIERAGDVAREYISVPEVKAHAIAMLANKNLTAQGKASGAEPARHRYCDIYTERLSRLPGGPKYLYYTDVELLNGEAREYRDWLSGKSAPK